MIGLCLTCASDEDVLDNGLCAPCSEAGLIGRTPEGHLIVTRAAFLKARRALGDDVAATVWAFHLDQYAERMQAALATLPPELGRIPCWEGSALLNGHRVVVVEGSYVGTVKLHQGVEGRAPRFDAFDEGINRPPIDLRDADTLRGFDWRLALRLGMPPDKAIWGDPRPPNERPLSLDREHNGRWVFYTTLWDSMGAVNRPIFAWSKELPYHDLPDTPEGRIQVRIRAWFDPTLNRERA